MSDPTELVVDEPPAVGYPVTVKLPGYVDGELIVTRPGISRATFTVEDGAATAHTRERAQLLLDIGGVITSSPPNGSGEQPQPSGTTSTRRSSTRSSTQEG